MMYVLDTNVLSELRKIRPGKADANVAGFSDEVEADDLIVSVISIMELELGVLAIQALYNVRSPPLHPQILRTVSPTAQARLRRAFGIVSARSDQ